MDTTLLNTSSESLDYSLFMDTLWVGLDNDLFTFPSSSGEFAFPPLKLEHSSHIQAMEVPSDGYSTTDSSNGSSFAADPSIFQNQAMPLCLEYECNNGRMGTVDMSNQTADKAEASQSASTNEDISAQGPSKPIRKRRQSSDTMPVPVPGLTKKSRGRKVKATDDRERRYACDVPGCKRAFVRREHLKRHITSIHTKDMYMCTFSGCKRSFSREDNMRIHLRNHHST